MQKGERRKKWTTKEEEEDEEDEDEENETEVILFCVPLKHETCEPVSQSTFVPRM